MSRHLTAVPDGGAPQLPDAELIAEFVAQADVADTTRAAYRTHVREFAAWLVHPRTRRAGSSASVLDARRADVARFMAYLQSGDRYAAAKSPRHAKLPSASTRKSVLASVRKFYRYLLSVELVENDPTYAIDRPKVRYKPGLTLTAEQLRALLEAKGTPRDRVQVYLLAFTAARMNEIRTLRWQDVNLTERVMRLHGKGDKYRTIDIHPRLAPELRRYRIWQNEEADKNPAIREALDHPETCFVLLTRTGRQLADTAIYKQLMRRACLAGLFPLGKRCAARSRRCCSTRASTSTRSLTCSDMSRWTPRDGTTRSHPASDARQQLRASTCSRRAAGIAQGFGRCCRCNRCEGCNCCDLGYDKEERSTHGCRQRNPGHRPAHQGRGSADAVRAQESSQPDRRSRDRGSRRQAVPAP
jgi:site-specific recombinase XerD